MTGLRTRDNKNVEGVVDKSGAQLAIEFAHEAVHRDVLVTASEYLADLDIATPRAFLIVAPAGFDIHFKASIGASAACLVELYKSPISTVNGTALQTMRHNLYSVAITTECVFHTPTKSNNGAKVFSTRISGETGGNPNAMIGGETREGEEIVVTSGNKALIIVTAEADNTKLWSAFEYYEVAV